MKHQLHPSLNQRRNKSQHTPRNQKASPKKKASLHQSQQRRLVWRQVQVESCQRQRSQLCSKHWPMRSLGKRVQAEHPKGKMWHRPHHPQKRRKRNECDQKNKSFSNTTQTRTTTTFLLALNKLRVRIAAMTKLLCCPSQAAANFEKPRNPQNLLMCPIQRVSICNPIYFIF